MATVRNQFHDLGNWHNKISLASIVTKDALIKKDVADMSKEDFQKLIAKVLENLSKIERYTISAEKLISEFKPYIYQNLDPDVEMAAGK